MKQQLEHLRNDAEALLTSWSVDRPFFVEFAGTPKSGKSTCIDTIGHFFRRLEFKVLAPTEGASKRTPYYLKNDFVAFNTWSASYALTHILEGRYGSDQYQIVILDRGLFDALAWFQLLKNEGDVSDDDCSTIQEFLLVDHWRQFVDMIFLFETDPGTSLNREESEKLINEPGRAMNPDFLTKLNEAYDEIERQFGSKFSALHVVNTSNVQGTSPRETAFFVASKMIEHMKKGIV